MPTRPSYRVALWDFVDRILVGGAPFILGIGGMIVLLLLAVLLVLRIVHKNTAHKRDVTSL